MICVPLFLFFVFVTATASAVFAVLCLTRTTVGATDTFSTALFRFDNVEHRSADHERDHNDRYNFTCTHTVILLVYFYAFRAYSSLSSLFFLTISQVKIPAMASTISQPTIGIQAAPKFAPVNSVPKKYTRKPTE